MNLKSLLIGSAAALVAAPAFAADVIIAEPEPVEYVEVCDVAGAGYFYIPGSRTCIQLSGLVRHELSFAEDRADSEAVFVASEDTQLILNNGSLVPVGNAQTNAFLAQNNLTGAARVAVIPAGQTVALDPVTAQPLTVDANTGSFLLGGQTITNDQIGVLAGGGAFSIDDNGQLAFNPARTGFGLGGAGTDGINSLVRAEFRVRTFTETELGDLTSDFRFRANDRNASPTSFTVDAEAGEARVDGASLNGSVFLTDAVIGLGGLSMGRSDTLFDGGSLPIEGDEYGGGSVHFIRYTADLGAFSAAVSVEAERDDASQQDYVPNVVGRVTGDIGAFSTDLFAFYDDNDGGGNSDDGDDGEFGFKANVGADFGPAALTVAGTYFSGDSYYDNGYEYSAGAAASFGLGEKATVAIGGQYFFNLINPLGDAFDGTFGGNEFLDEVDAYTIGAVVDYEIVDGFDVKLAVNYFDTNVDAVAADLTGDGINDIAVTDGDGSFNGFIRFDRSF